MTDELAADIMKALYGLRRAFAKHGIPCPDVLEYSDSAKAYKALPAIRLSVSHHATQWAMDASAKPWAEMSIQGFTLRFEARHVERPGTGAQLDDGISGHVFFDRPQKDTGTG